MASAGGVLWGCFLTSMLPLRRRDQLGCAGTATLAPSGCDRGRLVEYAVGAIQPDCRHYAAWPSYTVICSWYEKRATAIRTTRQVEPAQVYNGRGTCASPPLCGTVVVVWTNMRFFQPHSNILSESIGPSYLSISGHAANIMSQ
jgi:hypothetical protein